MYTYQRMMRTEQNLPNLVDMRQMLGSDAVSTAAHLLSLSHTDWRCCKVQTKPNAFTFCSRLFIYK